MLFLYYKRDEIFFWRLNRWKLSIFYLRRLSVQSLQLLNAKFSLFYRWKRVYMQIFFQKYCKISQRVPPRCLSWKFAPRLTRKTHLIWNFTKPTKVSHLFQRLCIIIQKTAFWCFDLFLFLNLLLRIGGSIVIECIFEDIFFIDNFITFIRYFYS